MKDNKEETFNYNEDRNYIEDNKNVEDRNQGAFSSSKCVSSTTRLPPITIISQV